MQCIILDTETTGLKSNIPIEIAYGSLEIQGLDIEFKAIFNGRFNPGIPIELGALATHHIMDEDLIGLPPYSDSQLLLGGTDYMVGHNIDYDWKTLGSLDVKRICTLALSRSVWPDIDSHTQSALLYHIAREEAREILKNAHSAAIDIKICYCILKAMWPMLGSPTTFEELWLLSESARIPKKITFGKHAGMLINEIPLSYRQWLMKQTDMDPYLIKAVSITM